MIRLVVCMSLLINTIVSAQNDTLLFEEFENVGNFLPGLWDAEDEDNESTATNAPKSWYIDLFNNGGTDGDETVAKSVSWLENPDENNRNWLFSPSIIIGVNGATLSWKSAPAQVGLFQDGYKVLVSTTNKNLSSFTETIFVASEYDNATGGFTDGDVTQSASTPNPESKSFDYGKFESFTTDLSDFAGDTIYIAFLHDSQNDNFLGIDDVLVLNNNITSTKNFNFLSKFEISPNPSSDFVNISTFFTQKISPKAILSDINGKVIKNIDFKNTSTINTQFDLRELRSGVYFITISADGQNWVRKVIKN